MRRPNASRMVVVLLANAGVVAILLLALEGLSGIFLSVRYELGRRSPGTAESVHTTYDELLGWVNLPNFSIPNLYGPGLSLRTNSQGFRNREDFAEKVPAGFRRLICSGDSFTLGYGVDDAHTWCELLRNEHPRLETVNMGQGGYGIDQAYLWYARDGVRLDHDVHVFAVITDDFRRAHLASFSGYPKPVLRTGQDGAIAVTNVPVPRRKAHGLARLLGHSRLLELTNKVVARISGKAQEQAVRTLSTAIIRELKILNGSRGSCLVLVYLPTLADYAGSSSDRWREFLASEAARQKVAFVDLVPELRQLPPMEVHGLFIHGGLPGFEGSAGHYTIAGNEFVARRLGARLSSLGRTKATPQTP